MIYCDGNLQIKEEAAIASNSTATEQAKAAAEQDELRKTLREVRKELAATKRKVCDLCAA